MVQGCQVDGMARGIPPALAQVRSRGGGRELWPHPSACAAAPQASQATTSASSGHDLMNPLRVHVPVGCEGGIQVLPPALQKVLRNNPAPMAHQGANRSRRY